MIRDVYFMEGVSSFAARFSDHFLSHIDSMGVQKLQVPQAMVALVATAVSFSHAHIIMHWFALQLYAAILEWKTGTQISIEFSSGAFIDVYDGNLNTLKNLKANHPNKYNVIMSDIYARVRCVFESSIFVT